MAEEKPKKLTSTGQRQAFFEKAASLIEQARLHVGRTADLTMCITDFEIGRMIVEQEQDGNKRAEYGRGLLKDLSDYLNGRFGKGFSETNLKSFRKFFLIYKDSIQQTMSAELGIQPLPLQKGQTSSAESAKSSKSQKRQSMIGGLYPFKLSWSHYQILTRIQNENERNFYEIESVNQQWTVRQLQRQYNSSLYERLALSRNKAEVTRLAKEGQTLKKASDILKEPLVLEFLGMEEKASYSETDMESAIINKLRDFLLELGKGFLFEARQKRFTFDEEHFFVDLVFYNRLLQCYVLIDIKTDKLKHQDLGQMQMYVNYFDRNVKKDYEKPTVGILLCKERNKNIVQLTLPPDANIYAAEYSLYLPNKSLLEAKLAEWVSEYEAASGGKGKTRK
jgi:predicted nuclease of restriction endonuclease-like (RecB) superfamily